MTRQTVSILMVVVIGLGGVSSTAAAATLTSSTAAWANYVAATESRIARELQSKTEKFLVWDFGNDAAGWRRNVLDGAIPVDAMHSLDSKGQPMDAPDGLIAHWRGSVFLPGVTLARLLDRLQHPSEGPHQEDVVALREPNQSSRLSLTDPAEHQPEDRTRRSEESTSRTPYKRTSVMNPADAPARVANASLLLVMRTSDSGLLDLQLHEAMRAGRHRRTPAPSPPQSFHGHQLERFRYL